MIYLCFSGMTTIHRPHNGGTLVIRPSNTKRRPPQQSYTTKRPTSTTQTSTVNLPNLSDNTVSDLDTASSISTGKTSIVRADNAWFSNCETISTGLWNPNAHTTQWHVTTQPNFVTKPRPSGSSSSSITYLKPKPSKQPVIYTQPTIHQQLNKRPTVSATSSTTASQQSKPQVIHFICLKCRFNVHQFVRLAISKSRI